MASSPGSWAVTDADADYMRASAITALRHYGDVMRGWCCQEVGAAEVKVYRDILYCLQQYIDAVNTITADGAGPCTVVLGAEVAELAE